MSALIEAIETLPQRASRFGHDVEGVPSTGVTNCSFAWTPGGDKPAALWVPLRHLDGTAWWPPAEEAVVLDALRTVLENPAIGLICHNASYELTMWRLCHSIQPANIAGDSMFAMAEIIPELERNISLGASLLTRQAYWGTSQDPTTDAEMALYNVTDSAVALELEAECVKLMTPGQRSHYSMNLSLLPALVDMEVRGLAFDAPARDRLVADLEGEVRSLQAELDAAVGIAPPTFEEVRDIVALKIRRERCVDWPDIVAHAKPSLAKP